MLPLFERHAVPQLFAEVAVRMQSETVSPTSPDPARGLPPVVPPSGGFIAQLFLVPGLIVTAVVLLLLGVNWFIGGAHTPENILKGLDNSNPEVRWREASDLAQVLLRNDKLASDPAFALELATRLRQGLETVAPLEKAYAERMRQAPVDGNDPDRKSLEGERNYISYLMACLSELSVPAGVPLLKELAESPDAAADADALIDRPREVVWASRRRDAIWGLGKIGENLQRFERLSEEQRQLLLERLDSESVADPSSERGKWAAMARDLLATRQKGQPRLFGLDAVFAKSADASDPFLRSMTALALNFWEGDAAENARLDNILVGLTQTGHGTDRTAALEVRYNAAVALARRGSERARLDLLRDMLDEEKQQQNFRLRAKDGQDKPDAATARVTVLNALNGVAELHRKRPGTDLVSLRTVIEQLAQSPDLNLRKEAERTLEALDKK